MLLLAQTPAAAPNDETYMMPPRAVAEAAQAPYYKNVAPGGLNADGTKFLYLVRDGMPSLASLAKPHYNLGGVQIDFGANRSRTLTTRGAAGLQVFEIATKKQVRIAIPRDTRVSDAKWSPDGKWVAFFVNADGWTRLYVADPVSGKSKEATGRPVMPTPRCRLSVDERRSPRRDLRAGPPPRPAGGAKCCNHTAPPDQRSKRRPAADLPQRAQDTA